MHVEKQETIIRPERRGHQNKHYNSCHSLIIHRLLGDEISFLPNGRKNKDFHPNSSCSVSVSQKDHSVWLFGSFC